MTLDDFSSDTKRQIEDFRQAYMQKHKENPEHYPLSLPEENDGLWLEFFLTFLQTGGV